MRKSSQHRRSDDIEDDGWLITFADMSVLLMCFFVLLFSLSTPDGVRYKEVAEALRMQGFFNDAIPTDDPYQKIKKELSISLGKSGYDKFIAASENPKGIDVELSSGAFFMPGSAKFTPEALPMLELIAQQIAPIAKADIKLEITGHTDDSPISSPQYPSNWELSAARAANVARFLISKDFPPEKLRVVGLSDTEPKAPNRDTQGNAIPINQELNRRVVVHMLKGEDSI